jgi:hypothetical protein
MDLTLIWRSIDVWTRLRRRMTIKDMILHSIFLSGFMQRVISRSFVVPCPIDVPSILSLAYSPFSCPLSTPDVLHDHTRSIAEDPSQSCYGHQPPSHRTTTMMVVSKACSSPQDRTCGRNGHIQRRIRVGADPLCSIR